MELDPLAPPPVYGACPQCQSKRYTRPANGTLTRICLECHAEYFLCPQHSLAMLGKSHMSFASTQCQCQSQLSLWGQAFQ